MNVVAKEQQKRQISFPKRYPFTQITVTVRLNKKNTGESLNATFQQ